MSKRTITVDATGEHVVTTNGVTTTTDAVMKLAVPAYDPSTAKHHPVTGINTELMLAVRDQIMANRAWWNQSVWRDVVPVLNWTGGGEDLRVTPEVLGAAVAYSHEAEPTCGTSMCFAGWATEIARADWVIDAKALKRIHDRGEDPDQYEHHMDSLLVRRDPQGEEEFGLTSWSWLNDLLAERGFTSTTHYITTVPQYATTLLFGKDPHDPLDLFNGNHSYEYVVAAATAYANMTERRLDRYSATDLLWATAGDLGLDTASLY